MANQKISQMTSVSSLTGAEVVPIVQSSSNRKVTAQTIANLATHGAVTAHTGSSWDGTNKYRELTGNLALTLSTSKRSGFFIFKQDATGSRTLTINGTSVAIASTANAYSIVTFLYNDATSTYIFSLDTSIVGNVSGGADVTPPTVISATATSANNIRVVFSEATNSPTAGGWSFNNGSALTIADVDAVNSTTWDFTTVESMTSGDTITRSYNSGTGNTTDVAGNELASFTGASVTNSIGGGGSSYDADAEAYLTAAGIANNSTVYYTGTSRERTGAAIWTKVDRFFRDLKGEANGSYATSNQYAKHVALYPMEGGFSAAHLVNAVNPGTYDLIVKSEGVHDENGIQMHATPGTLEAYFDTGIVAATVFSTSMGMLYDSAYDQASGGVVIEMGANDGTNDLKIAIDILGNFTCTLKEDLSQTAPSDTRGLFAINRLANNDCKTSIEGVEAVVSTATATGSLPATYPIYIGGRNNSNLVNSRTAKTCRCAGINTGLTTTETLNFVNALRALKA